MLKCYVFCLHSIALSFRLRIQLMADGMPAYGEQNMLSCRA